MVYFNQILQESQMPLTSLVFSHSLEQLVAQFSENYRASILDPFHPPEVIFASPISKQWLTQELTESMQVVAGLQGKYIESYLWDCVIT
jgi:exonuclease V gamma subunit